MPRRNSRIPKKARRYHGETNAESLVNWLNVTEDSVGRHRITTMIDAFHEAIYLEAATEHKFIERPDRSAYEEMTPELGRLKAAKRKLDELLAFYRVVPSILIPSSDEKGHAEFILSWGAAPGSKLSAHMRRADRLVSPKTKMTQGKLPGGQMGEIGALFHALRLIESGLISKIAICWCGKFYFKKFLHQRFHSQKCKLTEFRTSEEARTKRNEYARNLYHLHKSGRVK